MKLRLLILLCAARLLCGCASYQYRIIQPSAPNPIVAKQPVTVHYDPLDYQFSKYHDLLAMNITNSTDEQIVLMGGRSFVVDPKGESHPLRDRIMGPHSFTGVLLPPIPYGYPAYWGWGPQWSWWYGPGWYGPYWGGWYGPGYYGPPPVAYEQAVTIFDWEWKTGLVRLHLAYDRKGTTFEHDFEIVREQEK